MVKRSAMRPASEQERKKLGVPPAYTDVMIAVDKDADLIATATTGVGKTYYKYSVAYVERAAESKWKRVRKLAARAEKVVERIEEESLTSDVAMTARLILLTGMRNGGEMQGLKPSFGASSLLLSHCTVDGNTVRFQFPGKKSVPQDVVIADKVIASYVKKRRAAGEQRLFDHNAGATLRYMKTVGAQKVHDLRTWKANQLAERLVEELLKEGKPSSEKALKAFKKVVATAVSETLGNTPSVALKSYIDPQVWRFTKI